MVAQQFVSVFKPVMRAGARGQAQRRQGRPRAQGRRQQLAACQALHAALGASVAHDCAQQPASAITSGCVQERAAKGRAGRSALKRRDGAAAGSIRKPRRRCALHPAGVAGVPLGNSGGNRHGRACRRMTGSMTVHAASTVMRLSRHAHARQHIINACRSQLDLLAGRTPWPAGSRSWRLRGRVRTRAATLWRIQTRTLHCPTARAVARPSAGARRLQLRHSAAQRSAAQRRTCARRPRTPLRTQPCWTQMVCSCPLAAANALGELQALQTSRGSSQPEGLGWQTRCTQTANSRQMGSNAGIMSSAGGAAACGPGGGTQAVGGPCAGCLLHSACRRSLQRIPPPPNNIGACQPRVQPASSTGAQHARARSPWQPCPVMAGQRGSLIWDEPCRCCHARSQPGSGLRRCQPGWPERGRGDRR